MIRRVFISVVRAVVRDVNPLYLAESAPVERVNPFSSSAFWQSERAQRVLGIEALQ